MRSTVSGADNVCERESVFDERFVVLHGNFDNYIIDSFLVVVFGGVGNLWGTLVGALSLGMANKFLEPYAGAVLAKIIILFLVILFIQKRPRGLFALKGRAVEA